MAASRAPAAVVGRDRSAMFVARELLPVVRDGCCGVLSLRDGLINVTTVTTQRPTARDKRRGGEGYVRGGDAGMRAGGQGRAGQGV